MHLHDMRTMIARLALPAALFMVAPQAAAEEREDHLTHRHRTIRISSTRLSPQELRIGTDDAVAWLNYSNQLARISFDSSVAEKIRCSSKTSFRLTGDRISSRRVQGTQFASLCHLVPGEYAYRVDLFSGAGGGGAVERSLKGRIRVD